jgi:hypothetical protein
MGVEEAISAWDGKLVTHLEDIYCKHNDDEAFVAKVIQSIKNETHQKGATWLLKKHLESGNPIDATEIATVYSHLTELVGWESKLHILQSIQYMKVAESEVEQVVFFLRVCLTDTNKFVRAWTYNGFYEISVLYPTYKKETKQFFEMAMRDEAPSIKARIRNILKRGF